MPIMLPKALPLLHCKFADCVLKVGKNAWSMKNKILLLNLLLKRIYQPTLSKENSKKGDYKKYA